jgi:hypothetical protein
LNDFSGIAERVDELTRNMRDDQSQWIELQREVSEGLAQVRQGLVLEQKDRAAVDAELAASVKEARVWVEREAQAREKGDMALSRNLNTAREGVEESVKGQEILEQRVNAALQQHQSIVTNIQQTIIEQQEKDADVSAISGKVQEEVMQTVNDEMRQTRDGLAKVVEALQQERRARSEGDNKLREDCRDAVQKEMRARLERDSKFREELDREGKSRAESLEVIELAIAECRHGLESHTHELHVEGGGPGSPQDAGASRMAAPGGSLNLQERMPSDAGSGSGGEAQLSPASGANSGMFMPSSPAGASQMRRASMI